jgi:dihydroorotase
LKTIIRQARIINENKQTVADVLIDHQRIEKIAPHITLPENEKVREINAEGLVLIPGMIDDQVHFREPGLTHKGTIQTESKAAVAGGITSFMEMPNTLPNVLTNELLEEKYQLANQSSWANYSFFMGISKDNLEVALRIDNERVCGITDDGLYFNNDEGILANYPEFLEQLFSRSNSLIALHSEDDAIIHANKVFYTQKFGSDIPCEYHSKIRPTEACVQATKRVLEIAEKHQNRLHLFHISTKDEADLLAKYAGNIRDKRITAEACVHHLFFNEDDYPQLGNRIKWNPSIKSAADNHGLLNALNEDILDIIATDHAPHAWEEKNGSYDHVKSGGPLVQEALLALFEFYHRGQLTLEKIVQKTSHHVAEIYRMPDRGYIREGYFADLVLLDLRQPTMVTDENRLYKCGWSPFNGMTFQSKVMHTFVNGHLAYSHGKIQEFEAGHRLTFEKNR